MPRWESRAVRAGGMVDGWRTMEGLDGKEDEDEDEDDRSDSCSRLRSSSSCLKWACRTLAEVWVSSCDDKVVRPVLRWRRVVIIYFV